MSALREPSVGPIVGHTTDTSCRIWIRGADIDDTGTHLHSNRRTAGVIAVTEIGNENLATDKLNLFYFRLHRKYDRTGTFCFGMDKCLKTGSRSKPLKKNTEYKIRVATLTMDDPYADDYNILDHDLKDKLPDASVWKEDLRSLPEQSTTASFRTYNNHAEKELHFLVGSCRYPGNAKEADEIFGPLLLEARGKGESGCNSPADFVLMMGDQIYADMLNRHIPIGRADTFAEFQERYQTAFMSRNMRRLLSQVPAYMILDDHEIEDNWTQDRIKRDKSRVLFNHAISAYMSYQWSHGPRTFGARLYYTYECNGFPFFVLDTRTQRYMDNTLDSLEDNHLLGCPAISALDEPPQIDRLLHWLEDCQTNRGNIPKFIVSSSVFAPNPVKAREGRGNQNTSPEQKVRWKEESDSWPAFPETRRAILQCIIDHKIQNVIFLSGDIHCSNVAKIEFSSCGDLKAYSITSSALYWPFFFSDGEPSHYVHDSKKEKDTFQINATCNMDYNAWHFTQEDNFCRIDLDRNKRCLTVTPINKKGEIIQRRGWLGSNTGKQLVSKLPLATW